MKPANDRSYQYIYFIDGEMKLRMINDLMSQLHKEKIWTKQLAF